MKYRQAKKILSRAYKEAQRMQDEHLLSGSANRLVRSIGHQLDWLKAQKHANKAANILNFDYGKLV